ncbi:MULTISPECIES: glycerophosphodiester phosphodiesterase [Paenibacillus]|uniref:Glycerophosphoryl diester phosphodiesterase n=1 Tax=Paenibacillus pabuli TaxID=1472 RepID=A0A855Y2Y7_9BACL|nr:MULTISPECIES: glycerophosphodiester phosphodiesterase [Paenibacillus]PWW34413.1 glycerophosphoryl diester phosphodiesterase [Paenibacillus pabuli]PXW00834.1 glycerophosphoryl diester phosphodiesterase [Paenibacillus taichungensis]
MNKFPLITAHTGCMSHPDHSFESLEAALRLGVDIYEDDIRSTRDGVPVLAHDDDIALADGSCGSLSEMTLKELNTARLAPVPTLQDVLEQIRSAGKMMNLDIKTDSALEPVSALIERMGMTEMVFLSGCEFETAVQAGRYAPSIRRLLNVNMQSYGSLSYDEAVFQACANAREAGCFGINVPYQVVQPDLMEAVRRNGLAIYVWTVTESDDMRRLAQLGVDSITTRDPAKLIAVREETDFAKENRDWTIS